MLEQIFLKVLEMSLLTSMIIVIVCLIRLLLIRFPNFISYMLWSVVLFRLLCPLSIKSAFSPIPDLEHVFNEYSAPASGTQTEEIIGNSAISIMNEEGDSFAAEQLANEQLRNEQFTNEQFQNEQNTTGQFANEQLAKEQLSSRQIYNRDSMTARLSMDENVHMAEGSWRELSVRVGKYVWLSGLGLMLLYFVLSTIKIRKKVSISIPYKENIYMTEENISPFVMGIFQPKIYLPEGLGEREQEYIILHEKFHIRRLDHIVKPVAFIALSIHWFNPFVWIAFILFGKDMEMCCDEAVIKRMGEDIRADYSVSLLELSARSRILRGIPVDFGEGDTKSRIKNLATVKETRKWVLAVLITGVILLILCLASTHGVVVADAQAGERENGAALESDPEAESISLLNMHHAEDEFSGTDDLTTTTHLEVSLDIPDYYHTYAGDLQNLYFIDENHILWGSGRNQCGQLGQGTQDYDFHSESVQIAEHVIDVDYSQQGFVIYLTEDHKLYGMGNAGSGALQQYDAFDFTKYVNGEHFFISEPYLLMENVVYARCGRDDVACLTEDGAVWIWGTIWTQGGWLADNVCYVEKPTKVLENAVLVTGGWFHHAALLQDGTVWTWGYNGAGNCGVADLDLISEPTMVAENVVMVWTDRVWDHSSAQGGDEIDATLTGILNYDIEPSEMLTFDGIWQQSLDNTVIRKSDGTYWICGENVGEKEKVVHGAEGDYSVRCTYEFYPVNDIANYASQSNLSPEMTFDREYFPEDVYANTTSILMTQEVSIEGQVYITDVDQTDYLLNLFQNLKVEEQDMNLAYADYYLLFRDEKDVSQCLIEVWDEYICIDHSQYYKVMNPEELSNIQKVVGECKEMPKLSPTEILLSMPINADGEFSEEDIVLYNDKISILVETGYANNHSDEAYYYERYITCDGVYFDKDGQTTYLFVQKTIFYYPDGSIQDSYYKQWAYYDCFTGEQIPVFNLSFSSFTIHSPANVTVNSWEE